MKKSYIVAFVLAFVSLFMVGCNDEELPITTSTQSSIYQFYTDEFISTQNEVLTEISQTWFSNTEDRDKTNIISNNINILALEESVVLAGVQCYDVVSETTKKVVANYNDGFLYVTGIGNSFVCDVVGADGEVIQTFDLSVSKNNNIYTLHYNKMVNDQSKPCVAVVTFDRTISNLKLDISSVSEYEQNVQIIKNFYSLVNNQNALQVEMSLSDNGYYYGARYFNNAEACTLKLSRKSSINEGISIDDLTLDDFCKTNKDMCGYIINGKPMDEVSSSESVQNSFVPFGDLNNWW